MNKLENITNNEIRAVIDEYIHKERDRAIMKRRLCMETVWGRFWGDFE